MGFGVRCRVCTGRAEGLAEGLPSLLAYAGTDGYASREQQFWYAMEISVSLGCEDGL